MSDQFRPSQIELDMRAQLDDIRRKAGLDLAVPAFDDPQIEHRDGIEWHQAPIPPRWHRCKAQTRGLTRGRIDGVGTLCTVCYDRPNLQHIIDTITATPVRTKAQNTAISRARLRIQRITHNGRPYHPNAPHGTDNSYICYQCRCEPCTQAHAELDKARR